MCVCVCVCIHACVCVCVTKCACPYISVSAPGSYEMGCHKQSIMIITCVYLHGNMTGRV